jgi:hypothetical protein
MAKLDFIKQLEVLGYNVQEPQPNHLFITYTIPIGKFIGKEVRLGFVVDDNFPAICPSGPHFSPHILPLKSTGTQHPEDGVHASGFGNEWQYWSRPFKNWSNTDRSIQAYLRHVHFLLDAI